jgi:hypothetical protein
MVLVIFLENKSILCLGYYSIRYYTNLKPCSLSPWGISSPAPMTPIIASIMLSKVAAHGSLNCYWAATPWRYLVCN